MPSTTPSPHQSASHPSRALQPNRACRARGARGPAGRRLADRAAPAVRPRAEVRAGKPGRRAGLLRVPRRQPAERHKLPRRHPRQRSWATTSAPAPTSPPTRWAPASTSSSRSRRLGRKRGGKAALATRLSAALQRGLPALRRRARGALPRRQRVPAVAAGPRARAAVRRRRPAGALPRGRFARFDELPRQAAQARATSCAATTTCWRSSPRSATPSSARRTLVEAFPEGASARPEKLLKVPLYDYQREGALFAARGRPLPDRRRDGPGQDDPGHRRGRDHGPRTSASSAC